MPTAGRAPMKDFIVKFVIAFVPLFVAIDAIGMVAIFIGLGANVDAKRRQQQALIGIGSALAISVGFVFLGKLIFKALGITVADFQVAGGLLLLTFAVRDLLDMGADKGPTTEDFGVVPLGMPLIAGPALLTALLILVDSVGLVYTLVSLIVNLALVAIALCNAERFSRLMGRQGLRGVSKIIALLLAAIAISLIRRGWRGA
jgi:multiple antibiotic resistance protein